MITFYISFIISEYSTRRTNGDHHFNCGDLFLLILLIQTRLTYLCRIMQRVRNAAPAGFPQTSPVLVCESKTATHIRERHSWVFCVCRVNLKLLWGSKQSVGGWPADSASGKIKWKTRHLFLHYCVIINGGLTCTALCWCYPNMVTITEKCARFGFTWAEFLRKFVRSFN